MRPRRFLIPIGSVAVLALLVILVHVVHARFHAAETWAGEAIASGAAEPAARPELIATYRATYGANETDGDWLRYPVGADSYYYLRLAMRIADTGSACEAIVDGWCWDDHANGPLGRPVIDPWAPHPWMLAATHIAYGWIDADRTILASARIYSALLLVVLAAVVYGLGRRLGGPGAGGWVTACAGGALVALHPVVIERTFGADDDVWTLILMALGLLLAVDALGAGRRGLLGALGAGLACGLFALSWGGWPLLVVALSAAMTAAAWPAVPRVLGWCDAGPVPLRDVLRLVATFGLGFAMLVLAFDVALDLTAVTAEIMRLTGMAPQDMPMAAPPPDSFASVAELAPVSVGDALERFGWVLAAATLIGIALVSRRLGRGTHAARVTAATLAGLLAWGLAALVLVGSGERYILLMVTPLALLAAAGLGGLVDLVAAWRPRTAAAAALAATTLACGFATGRALDTVRDNRPNIDSAWVVALGQLREVAPEDAVVLGWWDAGHWIAFWSDRPVAIDGASLRDPRVHAVGRLLAADADRSVLPQVRAAACVGDGLFCPSGNVYLVLSESLLTTDAWMVSGLWQPSRAWLVDVLAGGGDRTAEADTLAARIAGSEVQGQALVDAARAVQGREGRALFGAPQARIWSTGWHDCEAGEDGIHVCPLGLTSADGWRLEVFRIDPQHPADATFGIRRAEDDAEELAALAPSTIRAAVTDSLVEITAPAPGDTNPGVLFDAVEGRVFVATAPVLRSLVTRLLLLDGRYDRHRFEAVADVGTVDGNRVQVWRYLGEPAGGS